MLKRIAVALTLLACAPATAHATGYDTWSPAGSPALDRDAAAAVALADGRALLAGGSTPDRTGMYAPGASAELYDPAANAWTPAAPLSGPRYVASATLLRDGRVLVAGGSVKAGYWKTAATEIYDPAANTWSAAAPMHNARMGHSAVLLADGRVLVFGDAANGNDMGASRLAEIYDPASDRWSPAASMPLARGAAAITRLLDGRVLVAGGIDVAAVQQGRDDVELASADVYDPSTDRWTATGPMTESRYESGVAALPDGRVLVAGGWRWPFGLEYGAEYGKRTAELLDPATLTWSRTGGLSVGRGEGATLVSTPTGTPVYLGGLWGTNNGGWLYNQNAVEAYDAATGTWSSWASMASKRNRHTALTLADGTLLVFGGNPFPDGSERLVPLPAPVPQNPAPQPTPAPTPTAPRVVAGKLSFTRPLPNRLKPNKRRTLTVKLRCTGGPCRDRLVLRAGKKALARVDIRSSGGATVAAKLKLSAGVYRTLRRHKTAATLALTEQDLTRWVTLTR